LVVPWGVDDRAGGEGWVVRLLEDV
jgi:hypothetical protein